MKPLQQIVVLGGGGFSEEPENPLLDDYILSLAPTPTPRICFLPTASGDADGYVEKFLNAFPRARAEASCLSLFRREITDPRQHLLNQDVIYVGGGSTLNLLAVWQAHGLDRVVREAWQRGVILAGISAGMNCCFEACLTDSFGGDLRPLRRGLGFISGSACPHYDSDPSAARIFRKFIADGSLPGGFAADNGAALHFLGLGSDLHAAVASRPSAGAYRVAVEDGAVTEKQIPCRYLGTDRQEVGG